MSDNDSETCEACQQAIKAGSKHLTCSSCKNEYHIACIFPEQGKPTYGSAWMCPKCRPKTPTADNTPIRGSSADQKQRSQDGNITHRKKPTPVCTATQEDLLPLTRSDVREIVKSEISNLVKHLNETMANFVNRELKSIKDEIASVKESMQFMNNQYEDIKSEIKLEFHTVNAFQAENEQLKTTVKDLNARVNLMEQQARSCNIEIQCMPEYKAEKIVSTVMNIGRVIACDISESQIHNVTRIAKLNPANSRPKSIVVQFNSPRSRDEFLAASIKYNKNNPNNKLNSATLGIGGAKQSVYITEHLSAHYKALHAAAREKAKVLHYKYVWVRNGKIFMRKSDDSEYKYIKDHDSLSRLD